MKKRGIFIIFCALTGLWILFIWYNSLKSGDVSGNMSGSVTAFINSLLSRLPSSPSVSGLFVRKCAHFLEFAALALLFCVDIKLFFAIDRATPAKRLCLLWLALPLSSLIAAIDETVQLFVPGRVGVITDVLIDSAGALCATAIFFGVSLACGLCRGEKT
jgi:VanZ family protein